MSLLPTGLTPMPRFGGSSAEERAARAEAQASALESLRINHPALFSMRVSPDDPGVHCLRTRFGVDVTQDNLLSVLLRPHAKRICDSLAPHGRKEKPQDFMYSIVKEALNNLDIDVEDLEKIGVVSSYNSGYTEETYIHKQISYLREALFNLHKLKTKTQKSTERAAVVEADRRRGEQRAAARLRDAELEAARRAPISEMEAARRAAERIRLEQLIERQRLAADAEAARYEGASRRKVERMAAVRAARGPRPPPEENLLGLHSAAAANAEVNLLNMNAARKAEIAANLEGLFGGKSRTRKHKNRRVRKLHKSRRNSRK